MARGAAASRNKLPSPPATLAVVGLFPPRPSRASPRLVGHRAAIGVSSFHLLLFHFHRVRFAFRLLFIRFVPSDSVDQSVSPSAARSSSLAALASPWPSRFPHRSVVDGHRVPPRRVAPPLRFLFHVAIILLPPGGRRRSPRRLFRRFQ